jgi:PAS domain S-box-containing protein
MTEAVQPNTGTLAYRMIEKFSSDREQLERYTAVAEFCPIPAFVVAHDGRSVVYVNKAYYDMMGVSLEEARNLQWKKSVHPDDLHRVVSEWDHMVETNTPLQSQRRYIDRKGHVFSATLVARRVQNNGFVAFIVPHEIEKMVPPAGISPAT